VKANKATSEYADPKELSFNVTLKSKTEFTGVNGVVRSLTKGGILYQYRMTGSFNNYTDLTSVVFALIQGDALYYHYDTTLPSSAKGMRAWFVNESTDATTSRPAVSFDDDEITGIRMVGTSDAQTTEMYDLQGRAVNGQSVRRGLYIRGGKKMFVK
jgi:hypothetical protein